MPPLLYKGAIRDLRGDDLLPLSMIRSRYPVLYHREAAKYAERPHVMDHPVHQLDCRWTDVVFFSPSIRRRSSTHSASPAAYWAGSVTGPSPRNSWRPSGPASCSNGDPDATRL